MTLTLLGEGKEYVDGELIIQDGLYKIKNAIIKIGKNGIEEISNGVFEKI